MKTVMAALAFLAATEQVTALITDPEVVDESPALSSGKFEVSRYVLDKNFNQFVASHRGKSGSGPSKEQIAAWFRLFVAQQAIRARLVEEGYLTRPEVRREVTRMVRQILTQPDGPLYTTFDRSGELTPERLRSLHEAAGRVFDALIVRFDDAATAADLMGPVSSAAEFEERVGKLARVDVASKFEMLDGPTAWPYGAFQEIADAIPEAPRGRVIGPLPRELGVYFLLVRGESRKQMPDFEQTRARWENFVRRTSQNLTYRLRRRHILQECSFSPLAPAVAVFSVRMLPTRDDPNRIDERAALRGPETVLATYTASEERRHVTDREFVRHFNERMIRSMPRATAGVVAAIEDMIVEEYDYQAAVAAGLDRVPKFIQDRRNFELVQVLALYENEVLSPHIKVSPDELRSYYEQRVDRFSVPSDATGTLYRFASMAAAAEALPLLERGDTKVAAEKAKEVVEPFAVRRDGPQLASDRRNAVILAMPDGRPIGPFDYSGDYAIFVKRSSGERQRAPFEEVKEVVRRDILREKLNAIEIELFHRRGDCRAVREHFQYEGYGIENPFLRDCQDPALHRERVSLTRPALRATVGLNPLHVPRGRSEPAEYAITKTTYKIEEI